MPLPPMPAWLIDYVTASSILIGSSRKAKNAIAAMCAAGQLHYCYCEESSFKGDAAVRGLFYDAQKCRCPFNEDIVAIMNAFPNALGGKAINSSDHTTRMLVASALHLGFGIISSKSGMFVTPGELGQHHQVTCLTVPQFISSC